MKTLEIDSAAFSYDNKKDVVKDLTVTLSKGDFAALIGPNGSGKSTLLKIASGILTPSKGRARLCGRDISFYGNRERATLVSYLPQTLDMNIPFSAEEIIKMGAYPHGTKPHISPEEALHIVGLKEKSKTPVMLLSGGERRRAFIAMLLVQGSSVMLFDEPFGNIDIKYQIELIRLIRKISVERKTTVVVALHDINMASQFDRIYVLKEGRLAAQGSPKETLTKGMIKEVFEVEVEDLFGHGIIV